MISPVASLLRPNITSSLDQLPLRTSAPSVVAQRSAAYGWNVGKYGRSAQRNATCGSRPLLATLLGMSTVPY